MATIYLEDENGKKISKLIDPQKIITKIVEDFDLKSFCCWRFVDLYGDTIFNLFQMEKLKEESEVIKKQTNDKEIQKFLDDLISLVEEGQKEPHQYLRFFGD